MTPPNEPSAEALAAMERIHRGSFLYPPVEHADLAEAALLIDEAFAGVRREREALRDVCEWFGVIRSSLERWEADAAAFHRDTGYLRPGKDYPAATVAPSHDERQTAWTKWSNERSKALRDQARALLAKEEKP